MSIMEVTGLLKCNVIAMNKDNIHKVLCSSFDNLVAVVVYRNVIAFECKRNIPVVSFNVRE